MDQFKIEIRFENYEDAVKFYKLYEEGALEEFGIIRVEEFEDCEEEESDK